MSRVVAQPSSTLSSRYWAKVDRRGPNECWPWMGGAVKGYGIIHAGYDSEHRKVIAKAHRIAWEFANGPIPDGLLIRHDCDNPPCQNPAHLQVGTQLDNMQDRHARGKYQGLLGDQHGMAKLTALEVQDIRGLHRSGVSRTDLAARFGVSYASVCDILTGRSWRHLQDVA